MARLRAVFVSSNVLFIQEPLHFEAWALTLKRLGVKKDLTWDEFHHTISGKMNKTILLSMSDVFSAFDPLFDRT